jgi:hypothetical protein
MIEKHTIAAVGLLLALAGCKDANGPENFNPEVTAQKLVQAFGAAENNRAVQSMEILSGAFTFTGAAPPALGVPRADLGRLSLPGAFEKVITRLAVSPSALLPSNVLGKTFIYSTQTATYQASDQAGAPSNGARFTLYAVDLVNRIPVTPLEVIGYVDLTDKSTAATNTLGIKAMIGSTTVMEYDAGGTVGTSSFSFTAKGFVADGANRLDFDLSQNLSGTTGVRIDYKLSVPTQSNLAIQILATATSPSTATVTLVVTENEDKLEVGVTGSGQSASGSVKYNGKTLASISVPSDGTPVFTGTGHALTAGDLAGLKTLYDIVSAALDQFDDVMVPAYFAFGLA